MPNSTTQRRPSKPRPDFPLFPHATGRWAKKVQGKFRYFGYVAKDPKGKAALQLWKDQKDDLLSGRLPQPRPADATRVHKLCNDFLNHKRRLLDTGEITLRTFTEYDRTCQRMARVFGRETPIDTLLPTDFGRLRQSIARQWGPVRLANEIQRVRSVFKYGFDSGLVDRPPRYGAEFKKPSAKVLRQNRARRGLRMFEREELAALLAVATVNAKAMILLAINCGLGNHDVGTLPLSAVDLDKGWMTYPRPKTGIMRRVPLWPETIEAVRAALAVRRQPRDADHKGLLFIGPRGQAFVDVNGYRVAAELARAMDKAKVKGADGEQKKVKRDGLSFYALRHTFQTIAEGARDLAAVQSIMGHAPAAGDMSAIYRERIDDERLRAVTEHVRKWLFPPVPVASKTK